MAEKFCDVASYQPSSREFFQAMVNNGVKAIVVKLTEGSRDGDNYINPRARDQVANARAVGLRVHFYHYFKGVNEADARNEARFFVDTAKSVGCDPKETVMVCDVEDNVLSRNKTALTSYVNAFFNEVKKNGFPHVDIYTGSSWARDRLNMNELIPKNVWLASYGVNGYVKPDNYWKSYKAWQYAGDPQFFGAQYYNGSVCDTNWDYSGMYTQPLNKTVKNGEYKENGKWYYYIDGVKQKNHWQWIQGSVGEGQTQEGKTVYYGVDGAMVYGWQDINSHRYWFDHVTGAMKRGFMRTDDNKLFYFNDDGWLMYGNIWVGEKHYYAIETTGELIKSLKFDKNGVCTSYDD